MAELKLGSIKLGNDAWSIGTATVPSGDTIAAVTVAADHAKTQVLGNYGTLYLDAEGVLTLKGGSALTGDVTISENKDTSVSLSAVSFGAPVSVDLQSSAHASLKTVIGSTSNDSISVSGFASEEFVLDAGAGNDTVIASGITKGKINAGSGADLVSITGATGEVALGAGKDTLAFGDGGATLTLTDYNSADDVVSLAGGTATLSNTGKLTAAGGVEVNGLTAIAGVYFARTTDGTNTTVYATAEEDVTKVNIDASSIKKEETVIIDATSADSANITLGKASVVAVSLKDGNEAVDTIKIGDTKATVNAVVTGFSTDDVLSFSSLGFNNSTFGITDGKATLKSGNVNVTLGTGATVASGVAFNWNGTNKLYAIDENSTTSVLDLTEENDLSKIMVKGHNIASVKSGIKTSAKLVNLDADNIYNIDYVELTADTAAKASVIGTKNDKAGITINASAATDGVAIWANNSGKAGDLISLASTSDGADTLWFGTTDGADTVEHFNFASDVLFLHDALTLTAEGGSIKAGKATMTFSNSEFVNNEEILHLQGAKFPGDVYAAGDFQVDDTAIVLGENAKKVNYYAVGKNAHVSLTSAMSDSYTFLNSIDYPNVGSKTYIATGGSVASINAGAASSDSKVIIEGVANVTLGAGTNQYWANGAKDAVVNLSNGTDTIFFSASDKKVTVTGSTFTDSDVVVLMSAAGEFSAKKEGTNTVISNANKGTLTITNVTSDVALVDYTGAKYKLYVDDAEYNTNTDGTNLYFGTKITASSEVTAPTNIIVTGARDNFGLTSSAIVDKSVKTIDMSSSSADFMLIGSATASNTITGGMGTNYLNGGGASKDVLNGNTGAVDFFYYGLEDGNDTLMNVGLEDEVRMYDINATDITTIKDGADKTVFTLKNDSKLTIDGSIEGLTFKLADGTYKYDSSVDGKWVKQEV